MRKSFSLRIFHLRPLVNPKGGYGACKCKHRHKHIQHLPPIQIISRTAQAIPQLLHKQLKHLEELSSLSYHLSALKYHNSKWIYNKGLDRIQQQVHAEGVRQRVAVSHSGLQVKALLMTIQYHHTLHNQHDDACMHTCMHTRMRASDTRLPGGRTSQNKRKMAPKLSVFLRRVFLGFPVASKGEFCMVC